jgi:hypothetical protein
VACYLRFISINNGSIAFRQLDIQGIGNEIYSIYSNLLGASVEIKICSITRHYNILKEIKAVIFGHNRLPRHGFQRVEVAWILIQNNVSTALVGNKMLDWIDKITKSLREFYGKLGRKNLLINKDEFQSHRKTHFASGSNKPADMRRSKLLMMR